MPKQSIYFVHLFIAVDGRQSADIVAGNGTRISQLFMKNEKTHDGWQRNTFLALCPMSCITTHRIRRQYTTIHSSLLASLTQIKFVRLPTVCCCLLRLILFHFSHAYSICTYTMNMYICTSTMYTAR